MLAAPSGNGVSLCPVNKRSLHLNGMVATAVLQRPRRTPEGDAIYRQIIQYLDGVVATAVLQRPRRTPEGDGVSHATGRDGMHEGRLSCACIGELGGELEMNYREHIEGPSVAWGGTY